MEFERYSVESLHALAREAMLKVGVPADHAETFATGCVIADIRGVESHGVARMANYVYIVEAGLVDAAAKPSIVHEAPATALVDANNGLGHVASTFAMQLAVQKARESGMGWVNVRNSNHYGIAGYYAGMALEHDMIGLCSTNAGPSVAPMGGKQRMLGTNPIAIAAPAGEEEAFLLDMATSAVAAGKFQIAMWEGKPIPAGWGLDAEGNVNTDPKAVLPGGGAQLPLGSFMELAGYKGYGLATAVDILCGVLGGDVFGTQVRNVSVTRPDTKAGTSHFFAALDVARFSSVDDFKARMDRLIRSLRDSARAPGVDRIYIAGEKEKIAERKHRQSGIPLHPSVVKSLSDMAARLELPFPAPVS
ncbi:MAG: Ldh family oxidoreductase [Chloroflexota bacterium]